MWLKPQLVALSVRERPCDVRPLDQMVCANRTDVGGRSETHKSQKAQSLSHRFSCRSLTEFRLPGP
jgi:hypothetical protein